MKIEIISAATKTVTAKQGPNVGKTYEIPEAVGYAHIAGEKYPVKVSIGFDRRYAPPAAGVYEIDLAASIVLDRNGRLALSNQPVLRPVVSSTSAKAA